MPKKNTKRTRSKKEKVFENPVEGAFYELFHPESNARLMNYGELKLVDVDQLKLIDVDYLNILDKKYLYSLIHIPTLFVFTQYIGAFVLSGILLLGIFSLYASMLTQTAKAADKIAQNYYNDRHMEVVEREMAMRKLDEVSAKSRELRAQKSKSSNLNHVAVVKSSKVEVVDSPELAVKPSENTPEIVEVVMEEKVLASNTDTPVEEPSERSRHITVVKSNLDVLAVKEESENKVIALATGDERIFRVYEIDKEPEELAFSENVLGVSTVSKVSTEPVCSFSYGTKKLASGASLYVDDKEEGRIYIDYRGDAARSVALVNDEQLGESNVVNYIDLSQVNNVKDLKVNVLNDESEFIGSCSLSIGNSTLASL